MDISKKLVETHSLSKEECLELFSLFDVPESMEYIKEEAGNDLLRLPSMSDMFL